MSQNQNFELPPLTDDDKKSMILVIQMRRYAEHLSILLRQSKTLKKARGSKKRFQ